MVVVVVVLLVLLVLLLLSSEWVKTASLNVEVSKPINVNQAFDCLFGLLFLLFWLFWLLLM